MLDRLQRCYLTAVEWLAILAISLIVLAAALTLADVVMRSIVMRPLFGTNDIVILLLTAGILACFPYCTATRQHLRVTALGTRLGNAGFWLFELFAGATILIILSAFVWQFALRAAMLAKTGEGTQLLAIPIAPVWWVGSALMAAAALAQCLLIVHDAIALVTRQPMPSADTGEAVV
jgi:TRAP-type C4-dicarboxylate transport system permease small subunit